MRTDGALVGADVRREVDRRPARLGRRERVRHLDAGELGEDLAVEVLVEVAGVAAVGEQRDREALLGQDPQERRLAEGVAVVADQPLAVPAEADPAQAPRVAEDVLVRQVGLRARPSRRRTPPRARRVPSAASAAGQVQPREGEHVGDGRR